MGGGKVFILLVACSVFWLGVPNRALAGEGWYLGIYGGRAVYDTLKDILSDRDYADSYAVALLAGRELTRHRHYLSLEAEGQYVKHFGYQTHAEFNALIALRWLLFPWDRYVDTSFAVGEGLSYATSQPNIEVEKHDRSARLLNYLMFELAGSLPQHPQWAVFLRVHHRSGVFGLFSGVSGGSNVVGLGVRYNF